MKSNLLILLLLLTSIITNAEKKQTPLNQLSWYSVSRNISSTDELTNTIDKGSPVDLSSYKLTADKPVTICSIIEIPAGNESKFFIEMENKAPFTRVLIDGQPLTNMRQDSSFTAEVVNNGPKEELLLTLVIDSLSTPTEASLNDCLKRTFLSTITTITVAWCEPLKDPFFGGYMVEVHVWNLSQRDIDGKLKAQITNASTFDLVAENNNCAFTRSNSEAIIDINFQDAKEKLVPGKYTIEIALVDKEKNEEVIDRLVVPICLN